MSIAKEVKPTPAEKRAQRRRDITAKMEEVFGTGKGSTEPTLNPLDYISSMLKALNYYNAAFENKDKRKWFMSYVGKKSSEFDSLPDYEFRSIGTLIRLKQRDQPLIDKDLKFIEDSIEQLRCKANGEQKISSLKGAAKVKEEKPVVLIQDRTAEAASTHIGEIHGMIDDFVASDVDIDVSSYLKANNVTPQVSKLIPASFIKMIAELNEAIKGNDKDLVEGYSHIKKTKLKKLIKSLEAISDACAQQAVIAKAVRKPRAHKEKPASVVAKNVKFMKEFPELKLTSEKPEKIIGASEVWIYNTKYKKIQVYRSLGILGIKGTSILNYDVATSGAKTIRKPEQVIGFASMTKRTLNLEFKNIKTKDSAVNGRINEECIILKVFS
jgi:hypothetical protein